MNSYTALAQDVAQKIRALRKPDTLVFPIFTDLHTDGADPTVAELQEALAVLAAETDITALWDLGDNLTMLGRRIQASNEMIFGLIRTLLTKSAAHWDRPLFAVNGNHDGIGTDFFDGPFWARIIDGFDRGQAVRNGNSAYFYIDYPESRVRVVCLSLPSGSDLAAEYPTPLWMYGTGQLQWLASQALNTPFPVLLVAHVPFYYDYHGTNDRTLDVFDGERVRKSHIGDLCGYIYDRAIAEEIFNAFQSHRAYDNEELNIHLPPSAPSASLIACLSGHMHDDSFTPSGEAVRGSAETGVSLCRNTLPCPQLVTCATNTQIVPNHSPDAPRIAMDIAVITPSERSLTMLRYGNGADRELHWN